MVIPLVCGPLMESELAGHALGRRNLWGQSHDLAGDDRDFQARPGGFNRMAGRLQTGADAQSALMAVRSRGVAIDTVDALGREKALAWLVQPFRIGPDVIRGDVRNPVVVVVQFRIHRGRHAAWAS
ncbi:MAG: hypothetical protein MUC40_07505 [Akkermansiaceae bacterium]|nr:hypothetical protein [Akkermansiaceae bacterium]